MSETVTFKGSPLTLKGKLIQKGDKIPDCELMNGELKPVKLSSFKGKPLLLWSVPSLDTPVCQTETHRFSKEIEKWGDKLTAVVVSKDLPFAQQRWCGSAGVKNIELLSDFKSGDFGVKSGLLINELGLLARAVFVCDENQVVRYVYLVNEVTQEPDYAKILEQLNLIVKK